MSGKRGFFDISTGAPQAKKLGAAVQDFPASTDVAVWRMAQTIWEGPDGDRF